MTGREQRSPNDGDRFATRGELPAGGKGRRRAGQVARKEAKDKRVAFLVSDPGGRVKVLMRRSRQIRSNFAILRCQFHVPSGNGVR